MLSNYLIFFIIFKGFYKFNLVIFNGGNMLKIDAISKEILCALDHDTVIAVFTWASKQ